MGIPTGKDKLWHSNRVSAKSHDARITKKLQVSIRNRQRTSAQREPPPMVRNSGLLISSSPGAEAQARGTIPDPTSRAGHHDSATGWTKCVGISGHFASE